MKIPECVHIVEARRYLLNVEVGGLVVAQARGLSKLDGCAQSRQENKEKTSKSLWGPWWYQIGKPQIRDACGEIRRGYEEWERRFPTTCGAIPTASLET